MDSFMDTFNNTEGGLPLCRLNFRSSRIDERIVKPLAIHYLLIRV